MIIYFVILTKEYELKFKFIHNKTHYLIKIWRNYITLITIKIYIESFPIT